MPITNVSPGPHVVRAQAFRVALVWTLGAAIVPPGTAQPQVAQLQAWGTDGGVSTIVRSGSTVYIGGGFTRVGPSTGGGVPVRIDSATIAAPFARVAGDVYAAVADGEGGWYVGGAFTGVGGVPRNNIAHVSETGMALDWHPDPDGPVYALKVSAQTLYVGGAFATIAGDSRRCAAAFDMQAGTLTAWDPSADAPVECLGLAAGGVFVGGEFDSIGGDARRFVAKLDPATGRALSWRADANDAVAALCVTDTSLFVGGYFTTLGAVGRAGIGAIDQRTASVLDFNPRAVAAPPNQYAPVFPTVGAITLVDSTLYLGGAFDSIGGIAQRSLAAVNARTGQLENWSPVLGPQYAGFPPPPVNAIQKIGGRLFVAGGFGSVDGVESGCAVAFDLSSRHLSTWNPRALGVVYALGATTDRVFVGGEFSTLGEWKSRRCVAALDARTGTLLPWDPELTAINVNAMTVNHGVVYVGGLLSSVRGAPRSFLAAIDSATANATAFNPQLDGSVNAIACGNGRLYIGGQFVHAGGLPRSYVACLDTADGSVLPWDPSSDHIVETLALDSDRVYLGGLFSRIGGQPRAAVAAVDTSTGMALNWKGDADGSVDALVVADSVLFVGGDFNNIGGQARDGIAGLSLETGQALPWMANASRRVLTVAADDTTLYVGGGFSSIGGQPRFGLAAISSRTGRVLDWIPEPDRTVTAVAATGGAVYAGGLFQRMGPWPQANFSFLVPAIVAIPPASARIALAPMFPNPTCGQAVLRYELTAAMVVSLSVYDVGGRRVLDALPRTLERAGPHEVAFSVADLAPGCYFCRLDGGRSSATRKLTVVR